MLPGQERARFVAIATIATRPNRRNRPEKVGGADTHNLHTLATTTTTIEGMAERGLREIFPTLCSLPWWPSMQVDVLE